MNTSPNMDDLLLDVATQIELSDRDRQVADKRYRLLKEYLERSGSPIAPYLVDDESHIYPQGSMSMGTTVVSGTEDDRFDLDALVEVNADRSPDEMMDLLYKSLKGFPDSVEVVRCTRCVQIRFAFMHMDVTLMDPNEAPRQERAGQIFHCPDKGKGESKRVDANPYGFSQWFRASVHMEDGRFQEALRKRRMISGIDRIFTGETIALDEAKVDDLPTMLPPRMDSEQVVALKLLKRYLCLRYEDRDVKRPPSIYISKLAADVGLSPYGLCSQLAALAGHIQHEMKKHLAAGQKPDERNPSYTQDRLNDRWPSNRQDMELLAEDMQHLLVEIQRARSADFTDIAKIFSGLFGERISKRSVETLLKRATAAEGQQNRYEKGTGAVVLASAAVAPAIIRSLAPEPRHNFHCGIVKKKK